MKQLELKHGRLWILTHLTSKEAKDLELFFKNNPESGFINTKTVSFKKREKIDLNTLFSYIKAVMQTQETIDKDGNACVSYWSYGCISKDY